MAFCHSITPRIFFSGCLAHVHPRFCLLSLEFYFDHPSIPFTLSLSLHAPTRSFTSPLLLTPLRPFILGSNVKRSEPSRFANRFAVFFVSFFFFLFRRFSRFCDFSLSLPTLSFTHANYTARLVSNTVANLIRWRKGSTTHAMKRMP